MHECPLPKGLKVYPIGPCQAVGFDAVHVDEVQVEGSASQHKYNSAGSQSHGELQQRVVVIVACSTHSSASPRATALAPALSSTDVQLHVNVPDESQVLFGISVDVVDTHTHTHTQTHTYILICIHTYSHTRLNTYTQPQHITTYYSYRHVTQ
jgi:hypothetical protein